MTLLALQATINAPTEAFRGCLKEASAKADKEKVAADAIDAYLRNACSVQMGTLKSAVIAFRTKNGMARKVAAEDANMTVDDYRRDHGRQIPVHGADECAKAGCATGAGGSGNAGIGAATAEAGRSVAAISARM